MSEYSDCVKQAAERFARQAKALRDTDTVQADKADLMAKGLMAAADKLDELINLTTAIPRSLGDVSDLPSALLEELSTVKVDELEDQIVTVINACDGVANIDQVLVGLYRKFKVIQTRRFLQNKLYRMMKSELIFGVPGRKGIYSTNETEEEPVQRKVKGNVTFDLDDEIPF